MKKEIKNVGIVIQTIISAAVFIVAFMSMFIQELLFGLQILLILSMCIMTYNNIKIYRRKYMNIIYLLVAALLIISLVMEIL